MSTMRHDNAGNTGTGTVTNNMKSRLKAWALMNGVNAPAVLANSTGVCSLCVVDSYDFIYYLQE